jgi:hypothetical protein
MIYPFPAISSNCPLFRTVGPNLSKIKKAAS